MKKQIIIGMTLVLITLTCSGCTQNASDDQINEQTISQTTESIQTILTKAETIESMYYEIAASITTSQYGTQTATIKIWQKTPPILKHK